MVYSGKETLENKIYIALNKPKGFVCSAVSDSHKTVYSLLPDELRELVQKPKRGSRLHTVGRLDCQTSGLLLLTTDGYFSNYLTRSENCIKKTYEAFLKNPVDDFTFEKYLASAKLGVMLPAEKKAPEEMALPFEIRYITSQKMEISVIEGKFHEVRRIFSALGNEVLELERISIKNLNLRELALQSGEYKIYPVPPINF